MRCEAGYYRQEVLGPNLHVQYVSRVSAFTTSFSNRINAALREMYTSRDVMKILPLREASPKHIRFQAPWQPLDLVGASV